MLKTQETTIDVPPAIEGEVTLVMCGECGQLQEWTKTQTKGHCIAGDMNRGWSRCHSLSFRKVVAG